MQVTVLGQKYQVQQTQSEGFYLKESKLFLDGWYDFVTLTNKKVHSHSLKKYQKVWN